MAKVIAFHEIELLPGVEPAAFERFAAEAAPGQPPGVQSHFLKGDRGRGPRSTPC